MSVTKIFLEEQEMPTRWYNIQADMPNRPQPALNPQTQQPVGPADLAAIFPPELIKQEVSTERWIDIPEEVQAIYKLWRPAPLVRARRLEQALGTPAKIYYKYEGASPSGSHKTNTSVPQAFYNKQAGIKRIATETGAGQWGAALSMACNFFDMECLVYMVKVSYHQKPYRRSLMQLFGASVVASPTNLTNAGRAVLEKDPESLGSLGIAISEAVEDAASREDTNYALGSVLNHVCLHQTIIGQEAKLQLAKVDTYPDVVIGCSGGGSNFAGISFPFIYDKITQGAKTRIIAVEPTACPTLTKGTFAYDYGDIAKLTPMTMMYTLGHDFMPPGIHAGGLRYHGESALVSQLYHDGFVEATAYTQNEIFEGAMTFARAEGIVPAPESAHAIKCAIDEALKAKVAGEAKTILLCLSGHGHFDMPSYDSFLAGNLEDIEYPASSLEESLKKLPQIK